MTTLLVSTLGGHLAQLHALVPRLAGIDTTPRVWVTHDDAPAPAEAEGEHVHHVTRDLVGFLEDLLQARP